MAGRGSSMPYSASKPIPIRAMGGHAQGGGGGRGLPGGRGAGGGQIGGMDMGGFGGGAAGGVSGKSAILMSQSLPPPAPMMHSSLPPTSGLDAIPELALPPPSPDVSVSSVGRISFHQRMAGVSSAPATSYMQFAARPGATSDSSGAAGAAAGVGDGDGSAATAAAAESPTILSFMQHESLSGSGGHSHMAAAAAASAAAAKELEAATRRAAVGVPGASGHPADPLDLMFDPLDEATLGGAMGGAMGSGGDVDADAAELASDFGHMQLRGQTVDVRGIPHRAAPGQTAHPAHAHAHGPSDALDDSGEFLPFEADEP